MNVLRLFTLLVLVSNCSSLSGQTCTIPARSTQVDNKSDSLYIRELMKFSSADEAKGKCALKAIEKAISLADEQTLPELVPAIWLRKGTTLRSLGRMDEALAAYEYSSKCAKQSGRKGDEYVANYNRVVILTETYKNVEALALAKKMVISPPDSTKKKLDQTYVLMYNMLGQLERNLRNYEAALNWYREGEAKSQERGYQYFIPYFLNNAALVYSSIKDVDSELKHYKDALAAMDSSDHQLWGVVQCNVALIENMKGQTVKARQRYLEVLNRPGSDYLDSCVASIALAGILIEEGDFKVAEPLLDKGIDLAEQMENPHQLILGNLQLGRLREKQWRESEAAECFRKAKIIAEEYGSSDFLLEYGEALASLLRLELKTRNETEMIDQLDSLLVVRDSLMAQEVVARVENSRIKFETADVEEENMVLVQQVELKELENRRKTEQLWIIGAALALLSLIGFFLLRSNARLVSANERIDRLMSDHYHRAMNDFGTIISLLQRHRQKAEQDGVGTVVINDLQRQIVIFTELQKKLRPSEGRELNFTDFFPDLLDHYQELYATTHGSLKLNYKLPDLVIPVRMMSTLALIINELVTNSMKYAGRGAGGVEAFIELNKSANDELKVKYTDGGQLNAETVGVFSSGTGLQLVSDWVQELRGRQLKGANQYDFEAVFPLS